MKTLQHAIIGLPMIVFQIIKGITMMIGGNRTHMIYAEIKSLISLEMYHKEYMLEQEDVLFEDGKRVYVIHDGARNNATNSLGISSKLIGSNKEKGYSYALVSDGELDRFEARCKIFGLRMRQAASGLMIETRYGNVLTGYNGQMLKEGHELVSVVINDQLLRNIHFKACTELSYKLSRCYQMAFDLIRSEFIEGHINPIKVVTLS